MDRETDEQRDGRIEVVRKLGTCTERWMIGRQTYRHIDTNITRMHTENKAYI